MRIKNTWFKEGREHTPQEVSDALAFVISRIADNALKNTRKSNFVIEVGPQYLDFLAEFLMFLILSADRIAYLQLSADDRTVFTENLANRVGETYAENRSRLLNENLDYCKQSFIDLLNQRAGEYADFGYDEKGPDYGFYRYLAYCIGETMSEADSGWIIDQMISFEAPEAIRMVEKTLRGLYETEPKSARRRTSTSGDRVNNPFDLDDHESYSRWRESKLADAPAAINDLLVEVRDPRSPTPSEHAALADLIRRCNMAIYTSSLLDADTDIPRLLGADFGLTHLDANWLAGEDGISEIRVFDNGTRQHYIPYTDRAIKWHTDGYYNPSERQIRAMVLHCVRNASQGGENKLMDHEMAYLLLRDEDPGHIHALMQPDAMTIPERVDESDGVRPAQSGPVFSLDGHGKLHMRYTARTRSIVWKSDAATRDAVAALERLLSSGTPHILSTRMQPGMGLLCNNVLHDRSAFTDDPSQPPRLLYRARYLDRIKLDN